ncbi:L-rhamnose mutarotase [Marinomonas aquiplantarum]|uniref:L-rhamnose mutarotase n=1 Tax=Marinomonas aquiplantarum TaxID=491951 RepID=A0A366D6T6_9GAMM|nr:L-rhamnose mutarotase [Marinomonas aquiplantarum]RBO85762.1 L-rhamnose mutarotase [Marinomonas aquiplantarum]
MRYASVMYLHKGCEAEYKQRHDNLWPELAEHLKHHGIRNYYIHLDVSNSDQNGSRLYATFDADDLDAEALADHPVMQRWWEYMADIMETKTPSFEPVADALQEVFRFNILQPDKTRVVAVLDIGKTNIKICLMDGQTGALLQIEKRVNKVLDEPPYPHVDVESIWQWIKETLANLAQGYFISSIAITTHGATIACMQGDNLVLPILDYEYDGVSEFKDEYDALRPDFSESFSPRLPQGLNLGAQLFWQQKRFPEDFSKVDSLLLYPQYWGYKLSGNKAAEVTSLGCHTDLWNPTNCQFSSFCEQQTWANRFPDVMETGAKLGTILPDLANEIGLPASCVIFNGIHDSNASLVPYIGQPMEKLTVVSSGTWTVIATINGKLDALQESKDMLANVDALGRATPTIRFMGGREWEQLRSDSKASLSDVSFILEHGILALPAFSKGGGPFAHCEGRIIDRGMELSAAQQSALADVYVALMTDYCLDLMDTSHTVIVEGAFSNNINFLTLLACMRNQNEIYASRDVTGTSGGAALLSNKSLKLKGRLSLALCDAQIKPLLNLYRQQWRDLVGAL